MAGDATSYYMEHREGGILQVEYGVKGISYIECLMLAKYPAGDANPGMESRKGVNEVRYQ